MDFLVAIYPYVWRTIVSAFILIVLFGWIKSSYVNKHERPFVTALYRFSVVSVTAFMIFMTVLVLIVLWGTARV